MILGYPGETTHFYALIYWPGQLRAFSRQVLQLSEKGDDRRPEYSAPMVCHSLAHMESPMVP